MIFKRLFMRLLLWILNLYGRKKRRYGWRGMQPFNTLREALSLCRKTMCVSVPIGFHSILRLWTFLRQRSLPACFIRRESLFLRRGRILHLPHNLPPATLCCIAGYLKRPGFLTGSLKNSVLATESLGCGCIYRDEKEFII